jgi:hypothetical protein
MIAKLLYAYCNRRRTLVAEHVRTGYVSLGRITDQLKTKPAPRISSIMKDLYVFSMGQECPTDLVLKLHAKNTERGLFPRHQSGRDVKLTIHLRLLPRLRIAKPHLSFPHKSS